MNWLNKLDGNKTYIMAVIGGIFAIIHLVTVGDYSLATLLQFSQSAAFLAMVAALRHAVSKVTPVPNGGNLPGGNTGPTAATIVLSLLLIGSNAFAQTASTNISQAITADEQSVNIPTVIATLTPKAVNTGYFWNWKDAKFQPTFTYPALGSMSLSWGTWDYVNIGYATPDVLLLGTGLTLNISVIEKKWGIKAPDNIQKFLNNLSIGFTPFIGLEDTGGRNRFTGGPGISGKVSW